MRASSASVLTLALLTALPREASADDFWAADKALHFGVSMALSIGGYAASSLVFDEPWQRALSGGTLSLAVGAGKEGYDAIAGGDPSWKDFAWDGIGTAAGISVSLSVDLLLLDH
jgi:putative lipoprotein